VYVELVCGEGGGIVKLLLIISQLICMGWLLYAPMTFSGELQRLFTTPEERNALNENRFRPPPPPPSAQELETFDLPDPPRFITFNGMMQQSEDTTIWVNNSSQLTDKSFVVRANADATVSITLPKAKYVARLRAGQTLDTLNNEILEAYQKFPEVNTVTRLPLRGWLKNWQ
jgi:hypothetical protein